LILENPLASFDEPSMLGAKKTTGFFAAPAAKTPRNSLVNCSVSGVFPKISSNKTYSAAFQVTFGNQQSIFAEKYLHSLSASTIIQGSCLKIDIPMRL